MPTPASITAITPNRDDPSRASVRVGRRIVATLSWSRLEELALAVGQAWDEPLAQRVADAAGQDKAMRDALRLLARRAQSRSELVQKLRRRGHGSETCERVVERLADRGEVDDEAFARALIREELARKPAGPMLLRQKLAQKGVDRAMAERVVGEAFAEADQVGPAVELARKRWPSLARFDPATRRRRLYGVLARRGFDADTIRQALQSVEGDDDAPF
ncbi:MAG: regulatory protein RecX [Phycisphaeraceae bacterium]